MRSKHGFLSFVLLIFLLFTIGFSLGTLVLTQIVKHVVPLIRQYPGWSFLENPIVILIITLYLAISFFLAFKIRSILQSVNNTILNIVVLIFLTLVTGWCITFWLNPTASVNINVQTVDGRFSFGPYPKDDEAFLALKKQGITSIISLLSQQVIPFEPMLLNEEIKRAKKFGIELINVPMMPWISSNKNAVEKIEQLAKNKDNTKYYVHCYYGEDRVRLIIRVVSQFYPVKLVSTQKQSTVDSEELQFSRGRAVWVEQGVLLSPMPSTDIELMYILDRFGIHSVVDLNESGKRNFSYNPLQKNQDFLRQKYQLELLSMPVSAYPYSPEAAQEAVNKVRTLRKPVLVVANFMPPRSPVAEGFLFTYLGKLPAVPKTYFQGNSTVMLAPHVIAGLKPTSADLASLHKRGIRAIACVDTVTPCDQSIAIEARHSGFVFERFTADGRFDVRVFERNGPWYVYGADFNQVVQLLKPQLAQYFKSIDGVYPASK